MNKEKVEGEVCDINYGMLFVILMKIWVGDYKDCVDVDLVVIIVGVN